MRNNNYDTNVATLLPERDIYVIAISETLIRLAMT